MENVEYETFYADVRNAGDGKIKEITIDYKVAEVMDLQFGDRVKVMIKKTIKKEDKTE